MLFKGNDGGAAVTALTLDMSDAGAATFNDKITVGDGKLVLNSTAVSSTAAELNKLDGATVTVTEINILDGDNTASSVTLVDADRIIVNDNGTMKQVAVSALNTYTSASIAADDVSAGDGAVNITTSSGNITIDAAANDSDIIFKGTDNTADITMLTLDGSDAGTAIFNHDIKIADDGQIGSASAADAMIISSGGIVTFKDDILIKDGGTIGSASDADAIAIAANGVVTMNQIPVFSAGINVSGGNIAGTLSTAAQANITSLGTLTTLTVDNIITNGTTIGHTDDTDLITLADGIVTVAGEVSMTTLDIGGTNVTSTAAELNFSDGVTSNIQTQMDTKASTGKAIAMAIVFG